MKERPQGARVHMIRTSMEKIPLFDFPEGFRIRPMRPDDIGLWTDVQRDAEEYVDITDDLFMREFGDDLLAVQERCYFVINRKGVAVGAISAWYSHNFKGGDWGRIHWVAIRPQYQGRGLGKAALSYAMRRLAEWHDRAWLATATKRIAAIKIYLDFGFKPDLDAPGAREAWREVKSTLKHPALENLGL